MSELWKPGDLVVERHVKDDVVRWAAPMWLAADDGVRTATYLPVGTTVRSLGDEEGNRTREYHRATTPIYHTWTEHHALHLTRVGDRYNVTAFWTEEWRFRCWYVNFQRPFRRYRHGFETMDETLDLIITPDLAGHFWKDEDEFQWGIDAGWYTPDLLIELKAIGAGVLEDARLGRWPFADGWESWRPEPGWGIPAFPDGWDDA